MNFGMIKRLFPCRSESISIVQSTVISTYILRYLFISLLCACVSLQNIWCLPVRKTSPEYLKTRHYSRIFLTFSDMRIPSFPVVFESANWSTRSIIQQFSFTVNSTKAIVFVVLRMRCQMGKRFVFVAYWCFPVTEDCFYTDRAFSSIFLEQENTQKTLENYVSSNVHGLVNVKKCHVFWRFLAVCVEKTRCYRRFTEYSYSHAFSSSCRSIIVRKMVFIPIFMGVLHR